MRRVLFRMYGLTFYSYPSMLYLGTVTGIFFGQGAARRAGLEPFRVWLATLLLLTVALTGARLLFVATRWREFLRQPRRIFSRTEGGAAQYGGLIAVPVSWPLLQALDLSFGAFWDVGILTILVGMTFTRVGCLLNGCCAGRRARIFGLRLPDHLGVWEKRVPTQLLEGAFAAVLLITAMQVWPSLPFPGALFFFVTGTYATGRLALESTRDHGQGGPRFTVHHAISAFIMTMSYGALAIFSA